MTLTSVTCSKCKISLVEHPFNQRSLAPCPGCGAPLEVQVFPAFFKRITPGQQGELVVEESESSCFYHPQKRAVLPCDACGRFLCALCDCELKGQHFCPSCLETGKKKGKIKNLENQRLLYDSVALGLVVYPLLVWPITMLTAPAAIFVALRYWNKPGSIVHRTKIRYIIALILGLLQIIAWIFIFAGAFSNRRN